MPPDTPPPVPPELPAELPAPPDPPGDVPAGDQLKTGIGEAGVSPEPVPAADAASQPPPRVRAAPGTAGETALVAGTTACTVGTVWPTVVGETASVAGATALVVVAMGATAAVTLVTSGATPAVTGEEAVASLEIAIRCLSARTAQSSAPRKGPRRVVG